MDNYTRTRIEEVIAVKLGQEDYIPAILGVLTLEIEKLKNTLVEINARYAGERN